ncbi:hypothetical protein M440DRAFT_265701 [Trichoderma longibrachiatum ATCC 18648]|uniref:Uncharacterized protein n=1 Tax=Trichoderma longibrachiatum ATCC 18648 TaxID=983965 RepID=A0A2T4CAM8_TRILO|nr:hypothetical protein M440DRAFT_265701 [Trichoderma longibrachiatum ATCC 18648]
MAFYSSFFLLLPQLRRHSSAVSPAHGYTPLGSTWPVFSSGPRECATSVTIGAEMPSRLFHAYTYCFILIILFLLFSADVSPAWKAADRWKSSFLRCSFASIRLFSVVSWRWRLVVRHGCPDSSNPSGSFDIKCQGLST